MADRGNMGIFGVPLGLAIGLPSLIVAVGIGLLIWQRQVESMGKAATAVGAGSGTGPQAVIDRTRLSGTIVRMQELKGMLENWRAENGGYPRDIAAARGRPGNPTDHWGADMDYAPTVPAGKSEDGTPVFKEYTLTSRGQDGLLGSRDDLVMRNGFMEAMAADDGGDGAGSGHGAAEEAQAGAGMVDPGPSNDASPAGMRALDQAREIAGGAKSGGGGSEE